MKTVWDFDEEMQPGGEVGAARLMTSSRRCEQAKQLQTIRVQRSPWFIILWEAIKPTALPSPPQAKPYCCYIYTVIFYKQPYYVDQKKGNYAEWARVETALRCDDVLEFEGELFEVGPGQIVWHEESGSWYCRTWARRK